MSATSTSSPSSLTARSESNDQAGGALALVVRIRRPARHNPLGRLAG
jgi:hypothetical protein